MSDVLAVDLAEWRSGGSQAKAVLDAVDAGLQDAGFLLIRGHGVRPGLAADVRAAAREFFALPTDIKVRYATNVGGRGYIGPGREANGSSEGERTPPDLKETLAVGPEPVAGDDDEDRKWFRDNAWPTEVDRLQPLLVEYTTVMRSVADEILSMLANALNLPTNPFATLASRPTWTCNVNHYPPLTQVGDPAPGQFRIGAHTDFGMVTLLDREQGAGGLQIFTDDGGWQDAPHDPEALTVNIGDLLEYWSGKRWRSGRHRVLPPQSGAPEEDLVSLIYFYDLNHDAVVEPCTPPVGVVDGLPAVQTAEFIKARLASITVG